jgi:hypothetical protein
MVVIFTKDFAMCISSSLSADAVAFVPAGSQKMQTEVTTVRKDVVNPSRLEYLCVWGGPVVELDGYMERLRKYKSHMVIAEGQRYGTVEVKYEEKSGRLYGGGFCLQTMPSVVRNFIIDDRVVDIDIKNAAPTILQQVCKINNIETPCLDHFNLHYKRLLKDMKLEDVSKAKGCIFFGASDGYDGGLGTSNPAWLSSLQTELNEAVFNGLKGKDKYAGLLTQAEISDREKRVQANDAKRRRVNRGGDYVTNVRGIFLSLVYFMEETAIMKSIDSVGRRNGIWDNRVSMVFDGMLVLPRSGGSISLADLDRISAEAYQQTGIRVRLDLKPTTNRLDLDITRVPQELIVLDYHREAADMMLYFLRGDVCRDGPTAYARRDGVWNCNTKAVQTYLLGKVLHSNIQLKMWNGATGNWEVKPFTCKADTASLVVKAIIATLPIREGFGRDLVLNSSMKLLFKNGYYEFLEEQHNDTGVYGRFIHGKTFDSGVMIPWEFPLERIQEDIDFVKLKYFQEPFENSEPGLMENFFRALARALAGTPEKITNLVNGARNCGKSVTLQLMKYCFGDYVTCINAGSFQVSKGSSDSTRDYSWGLDCEHARVIFISETMATDKSGVSEMCGNKLKQFQSMKEGAISGRRLYNDQRNFHSIGKGFILCNDPPTFKPHDAYKMVHPYAMPNKFVSIEELNLNRHQPSYKLADPMIEQWYRQDKYRDALIFLILESFYPSEVVPTAGMTEDLDIMEDEVSTSIYEDAFVYTGLMSDKIPAKKVREIVMEHIPTAKHQSIRREMLKRVLDAKPNFNPTKISVAMNGYPHYAGVKIRTMADDQDTSGYAAGFRP